MLPDVSMLIDFARMVIEIAILALVIYKILYYMRGARGSYVLAGIIILLVALIVISQYLKLEAINFLLQWLLNYDENLLETWYSLGFVAMMALSGVLLWFWFRLWQTPSSCLFSEPMSSRSFSWGRNTYRHIGHSYTAAAMPASLKILFRFS